MEAIEDKESIQSQSLALCNDLLASWKKHLHNDEVDHVNTLLEAFHRLNLIKENITIEDFLQTIRSHNVPVTITSKPVYDSLKLKMKSNFPIHTESLLPMQGILERVVHQLMQYFGNGSEEYVVIIKDGLLQIGLCIAAHPLEFLLGGLVLTASIFLLTRLWSSLAKMSLTQKWMLIESENIQWIQEKLSASNDEGKQDLKRRLKAAVERNEHYQAEMVAEQSWSRKTTHAAAGATLGLFGGGGLAFAFASTGALIGSGVPIVGTAVGAAVGASIGAVAGWFSTN